MTEFRQINGVAIEERGCAGSWRSRAVAKDTRKPNDFSNSVYIKCLCARVVIEIFKRLKHTINCAETAKALHSSY